MKCPKCNGEKFWRRFNTPINGVVKTIVVEGCLPCHYAQIVDEFESPEGEG